MKKLQIVVIIIIALSGKVSAQSGIHRDWIKIVDSAAFSPRADHQLITYENQLFLIGGNNSEGKSLSDIWSSSDMLTWKFIRSDLEFKGGTAVVFLGKIWIINAEGKSVWNSLDGINWEKVSVIDNAAEFGTSAVVFKNKIWLTGGADVINAYLPDGVLNPDRKVIWKNDVWSSGDGINWKKENTPACFSDRSDHSIIVFDDKIWVLCGQSGPNKNDIWNSCDGINWKLIGNAPFTARHVCEVVNFENRIWVIGGFAFNSSGFPVLLDDVWNSCDGVKWNEVSHSHNIGTRMEHQVVAFKDQIWLIAGQCGDFPKQSVKNDIWILGK
jgi:hypothetical protein